MKTNYRLRDGDKVKLLINARVDGYWHDDIYVPRGCSHYMLKGCIGKIIEARTPCVMTLDGKIGYFANIDIEYMNKTYRVRLYHSEIRKVRV